MEGKGKRERQKDIVIRSVKMGGKSLKYMEESVRRKLEVKCGCKAQVGKRH